MFAKLRTGRGRGRRQEDIRDVPEIVNWSICSYLKDLERVPEDGFAFFDRCMKG
jgi:hypothetical protein